MALLHIQRDVIQFEQFNKVFTQTQEVLVTVAQYLQPIREVQSMCDCAHQISNRQRQITDLQTPKLQPPQCDDTKLQQQEEIRKHKTNTARRRPAAPGTYKEQFEELPVITWDAQLSGERVSGLRMQLVNASSSSHAPGSGRQRHEISRLPGQFRVVSK
jgi:hypothetical protein